MAARRGISAFEARKLAVRNGYGPYGAAFWSALKFATLAPSLVKEFSTQLDNRANQDGALPKIIVQICCR